MFPQFQRVLAHQIEQIFFPRLWSDCNINLSLGILISKSRPKTKELRKSHHQENINEGLRGKSPC